MTYKIYFIEKTRAQLCHSVHTTTDAAVKGLLVAHGTRLGFNVRIEAES